jgi:hypothetical protein
MLGSKNFLYFVNIAIGFQYYDDIAFVSLAIVVFMLSSSRICRTVLLSYYAMWEQCYYGYIVC